MRQALTGPLLLFLSTPLSTLSPSSSVLKSRFMVFSPLDWASAVNPLYSTQTPQHSVPTQAQTTIVVTSPRSMSYESAQWLSKIDWARVLPSPDDEVTRAAAQPALDLNPADEATETAETESALANDSDDTGNDKGYSSDCYTDEEEEDDEAIDDESNKSSNDHDSEDENDDETDDETGSKGSYKRGENHDLQAQLAYQQRLVLNQNKEHVGGEDHEANKPTSSDPEARQEEQRNTVETKDTWEYLKHSTISKDSTKAGASEKEKLAALDKDSCTSAGGKAPVAAVRPGLPQDSNHALQDYQMQLMLLEQQHKKRLMMERQEQDSIDMGLQRPENHVIAPIPTGDAHSNHGTGAEGSNALRIAQLEEQIQILRREQNSLKSTTWVVLHKIEDDPSTYFVEPSWTWNKKHQLILAGNSPLADEEEYLRQRPDVAFVVYKHYQHYYQTNEIKKAKADGSMLPAPRPAMETIQLLSDQMVSAMDAFIDAQPTFETCFPDWQSKRPIASPFLFWYHYGSPECLDALPEPSRGQMQLLTGWIDQNYNGIYAETRSEFDHGRVCWSTMPFFVQPGEVLVSKNDKGIQGYIAESWPVKIGNRQYSSTFLRGEPRKISQRWSIRAWSYGYDGRFYRRNTNLEINLEFDEDEENIEMSGLQVLPLRFADSESYAKLDHRGRVMWACRHRKLIAYTDGDENDFSGVSLRKLPSAQGRKILTFSREVKDTWSISKPTRSYTQTRSISRPLIRS